MDGSSYRPIVALAAGLSGVALAAVPETVGYNGVLFKEGDCAGFCGTKTYDMTFRYFKTKDGDDQVGVDVARSAVPVNNGYFHVDLDPPGAGAAWLELAVDDGSGSKTLSPRVALSAVPYALSCGDSATVGGQLPSVFAVASQVYTKTDVDTALAGKADSGASYTKAESDALYAVKSLEAAVTTLQAAVTTLQATVTAQGTTISGLQATVSGQATTIAGLQGTIATLQANNDVLQTELTAATTCPSDMVKVGDFCVERYESSLWAKKVDDGTPIDCGVLQAAVDEAIGRGWTDADIYKGYDGTQVDCLLGKPPAMCSYRQYGSPPGCVWSNACDDYPAEFPDSGNWTKPLYACAIKGVMPSRSMTWFQAQQACVNAGKHMITNGEWQAAVAGTPDTTACNTNSAGPSGSSWKAGHGTCKSATGVEDMIGNLWEWVDLWGQAGPVNTTFAGGASVSAWPSSYGDGGDLTWNVNGRAANPGWTDGAPFAATRGGDWGTGSGAGAFAFSAHDGPSGSYLGLGARCARGL